MRIIDIITEAKQPQAPKPRNFVAKNAKTGGAGAHKDKKKAEKQGDVKHKGKVEMDESFGRRSSYSYNPDRDAEREWDAARRADQDFRNRERNAGDDGEDYYRQQMDKDRGPWYIKIDGKIYKQKGIPKSFDWKSGAKKYGMAILKNNPDLQGKIYITKKAKDDAPNNITEDPSASTTNAGNVTIGAIYKNKAGKTPKNKDGTAKNALDMKGVGLLTGGSIKR